MDRKQERMHLLERQIERLQRRIQGLRQRSNRYSWTRVAIFFLGFGSSLLLFFLLNRWMGLALGALTIIVFAVVAHYHGIIERGLNRHITWQRIKETHVARMKLDWEQIPPAYPETLQADHPFEFDLDISGPRSIHRLLNTAISLEGSERLHDWLLSTKPERESIEGRQGLVRELIPLTRFRDKLLMKSLIASQHSAQLEGKRLLVWLEQQATPAASFLPLIAVSLVLNLLTIVLLALGLLGIIAQYWILSLLANLAFLYVTKEKRGDLFDDATYLRDAFATLSGVFSYLEHYPYGEKQLLKKLCEPFYEDHTASPSGLLKRTARLASAVVLERNGLLWMIVNTFLPWDNYYAYRLNLYKQRIAERLPRWLDTWYEVEAISSLATFGYLNPAYILPEVHAQTNRPCFQASDLGHPLLPDTKKVANSFVLDRMGEIDIVTGSNMAGKSTFLRTVGLNLVLAYAGSPVSASSMQTGLFKLYSCIRISDSVTEGYSYFYAEVRRLKAMLQALEQSEAEREQRLPLFFLIDEIFKGTNNRERLIGSRSFVRAVVGRNCVGLISTHDLELVRLADELPLVKNYHFREDVIDGEMVFDYRLRGGPSPTTNALKIMRLEGLPVEEEPSRESPGPYQSLA